MKYSDFYNKSISQLTKKELQWIKENSYINDIQYCVSNFLLENDPWNLDPFTLIPQVVSDKIREKYVSLYDRIINYDKIDANDASIIFYIVGALSEILSNIEKKYNTIFTYKHKDLTFRFTDNKYLWKYSVVRCLNKEYSDFERSFVLAENGYYQEAFEQILKSSFRKKTSWVFHTISLAAKSNNLDKIDPEELYKIHLSSDTDAEKDYQAIHLLRRFHLLLELKYYFNYEPIKNIFDLLKRHAEVELNYIINFRTLSCESLDFYFWTKHRDALHYKSNCYISYYSRIEEMYKHTPKNEYHVYNNIIQTHQLRDLFGVLLLLEKKYEQKN